MAKLFTTDESIKGMIEEEFEKTNLEIYSVQLKVMSTKKARDMITVKKGSPTTNYIIHADSSINITVYEDAFTKLSPDYQQKLIEMTLSNVWYDTEKDRLNVETNPFKQVFNMRKKYGNEIVDILETSYIIIDEIQKEEKEKKD